MEGWRDWRGVKEGATKPLWSGRMSLLDFWRGAKDGRRGRPSSLRECHAGHPWGKLEQDGRSWQASARWPMPWQEATVRLVPLCCMSSKVMSRL